MYDRDGGRCECHEGTFDSGEECLKCVFPLYFEVATKSCQECGENQVYSMNERKCVACPEEYPMFNG